MKGGVPMGDSETENLEVDVAGSVGDAETDSASSTVLSPPTTANSSIVGLSLISG